uniref:U23-Lycotoxin-Lsp1a_1 n=1 Tax=Lycosa sp. SGP-2016 TaxID=1905177 RepID=A0A482Z967_9ARAC
MKHFAFLFAVAGAFVLVASAPSEEGDEAFPDVIETPRKSCLEIGEVCDGNSNDCQCCRSNGFCSCSWIFNHCTCQVATPARATASASGNRRIARTNQACAPSPVPTADAARTRNG